MARLLLIEDNEANRILVDRILTAHGHTIRHAVDGESGIEQAVEETFDLILVDMGLPDIDGQTVVALLQQIPRLKTTPMVAITAWPAEKAMETAERYGLAGCILKPLDVARFPEQIATFLETGTG
ncbi:MAG: response regulator [Candidatus Promineifilaceae bacterium]|nr:response regulator [Candidatus Promineifilaceae bacterium]